MTCPYPTCVTFEGGIGSSIRNELARERALESKRLKADGISVGDIGARLGLSRRSVFRHLALT